MKAIELLTFLQSISEDILGTADVYVGKNGEIEFDTIDCVSLDEIDDVIIELKK